MQAGLGKSTCHLGGAGCSRGPAPTWSLPALSTCSGGRWRCQEVQCPGTCSVLGGAHFSTFDERQYTVHGDCSYVLAKVRGPRVPPDRAAFRSWAHMSFPSLGCT